MTNDEMLILLIEECGEVIQAATKCLRFGPNGNHPAYGNNTERLAVEIGDLLGVIGGIAFPSDCHIKIEQRRLGKMARAEAKKIPYGYR